MVEKINRIVRALLCIMIFCVPFGTAWVAGSVGLSVILIFIKRWCLFYQQLQTRSQDKKSIWNIFKVAFAVPQSPLNYAIGLFIIACLLASVFSTQPLDSFLDFVKKTLVRWFLLYYIVLETFKTPRQIYRLIFFWVAGAALISFDGIQQYFWTWKDFIRGVTLTEAYTRATASFKTANGFGGYLVLFIPFSIIFALRTSLAFWQKLCLGFVSLASLLCVVITWTRGAYVAVAAGILFLGLLMLFMHKNNKRLMFVPLIVFLVLIVVTVNLTLDAKKSVAHLDRDNTAAWRVGVWVDTVKMIKHKPIFGHGMNTFMEKFQEYRSRPIHEEWAEEFEPTYAHNCYLQITAEAGLVGIITFLLILIQLLVFSVKSCRRVFDAGMAHHDDVYVAIGLLSGIFAFLVHSGLDTNLYSLKLSAYFWLIVGVFVALLQVKIKEIEQSSKHEKI